MTEAIVSGILGEKRSYPHKKIAGARRGRSNGFLLHLLSPCGEGFLQAQTSPLSTPTPSPALLQRRLSFTLYLEPITSWVLCVFLYHFASVCTPSKDRYPLQGTHSLKTRCQTGHQEVTTSEKEGEVSCPDLALNIQDCGQEQRSFLRCSLAFGTSLTQGWGGTG